MRVIGLMSGTSYDAVDAAAADLDLDGDTLALKPLGLVSRAYDDDLHEALTRALPPAATTVGEVSPAGHPHRTGVRGAGGRGRP